MWHQQLVLLFQVDPMIMTLLIDIVIAIVIATINVIIVIANKTHHDEWNEFFWLWHPPLLKL